MTGPPHGDRGAHPAGSAGRAGRGAPIVAVVLAAGSSTRFGSQKLLADTHGEPLIRRTVRSVIVSEADLVLVVTGAAERGVRHALAGLDVAFAHNARYAEGMGTSIAAGVRALPQDAGAVVITLGDQPSAGPVVDAVIEAFRAGDRQIVMPEYEGIQGPPVLFGRAHFASLESLEGDRGARDIALADPTQIRILAMEGRAPADIDTRSDHRAFVSGTRPPKEREVY